MAAPTTIGDVLSGNQSLKLEVSVSTISVVIIAVSVFAAVLMGVVIARKIS